MSDLGFGNIGLKRNAATTGPPFMAGSAVNGVSVDPVSGAIVLGNDVAAVLAVLLSNREIPLSTFSLLFSYPTVGNSITIQNNAAVDLLSLLSSSKNRGINIVFTRPAVTATGIRIQNTSTNGGAETDLVNDAGRGAFWDVLGTTMAGGDITRLQVTGNELRYAVLTAGAIYRWFTGATQRMAMLNNGNLRLAANNTDNTARLQVDGAGSMDKIVSARNISPVAINLNQERDFVFTNEGAGGLIVFNLPAAVSTGTFTYTFAVQNVNGIQVTAAAGDTIRIAGVVSAAGGTTTSVVIGSVIKLQCINATEWFTVSVVGTWTIP